MFNQVVCGDCVPVLRSLPSDIARLVVADPPYFNVLEDEAWDTAWATEADYLTWTMSWIGAAMRVLMPGGLLYCFGQVGKREHVFLHLMSKASSVHQFHDLVIWDRVVGYNDRKDSWTPAYEMALVLRKNGAQPYFDKDVVREPYDASTITRYARDRRYKNREARMAHLQKGKYATNLWRVPSLKGSGREKVGHPSQKPLAIIERIVRSSSGEGDLVIDPFLGSGTTAVVAQNLQRRWLGIEKCYEYVAMSRQRLENHSATTYENRGKLQQRHIAQSATNKGEGMTVTLNSSEMDTLARQNPDTEQDGGFQGFLVALQKKLNQETGEIDLNDKDLERIPKYAFDYNNGGWQDRLIAIFGRVLGPQLGR